jgi:transposase-like protein/DNA-directed RNA polymerase subunit F
LRPTQKKPPKAKATGSLDEAKRKKAVIDAVETSSDSIKATLEDIGLAKSTYYKWVKAYKKKGLKGLEKGGPVAPRVWQRVAELDKGKKSPVEDSKLPVEETQTMKSKDERTKELLFRKFDDQPTKAAAKAPESVSEPPSAPSPTPPPEEPMDKTLRYAILGFGAVIAILLLASLSNSNNFYFKQNDQMVELWQGRFAPMGEHLVSSFSDAKIFESVPEKDVYSRKQAYGILSAYFVKRADEILRTAETPDVKTVKSYLNQASGYAQSESEKQAIRMRLNSIEFLILMSRADLALNKGTPSEFEAARKYLSQAIPLASTDLQKDVLMQRLAAVEYALATHKIEKGEKQLAQLYREALQRHLQKAQKYSPERSEEINQEMSKIQTWLDDFDKKHVGAGK